MSKFEIKRLFFFPSGSHMPVTLNIMGQLWWRFVPGTVINVRWPVGDVEIDESMPQWDWTIGPPKYKIESADPNDHYRPFLEKYVGKQGWDWDWGMADRDATDNRLTIKIRRKHARYATLLAMRWS